MSETLEARIADLESREAIRDLVHRYALFIRLATPGACAPLFTDDAIFETREASALDPAAARLRERWEGREAIVAKISGGAVASLRLYPSITNLLIELDGATATATALMTATMWPGGRQVSGHYQDSFHRDGCWRFSQRIYTILV